MVPAFAADKNIDFLSDNMQNDVVDDQANRDKPKMVFHGWGRILWLYAHTLNFKQITACWVVLTRYFQLSLELLTDP